MIINGKNVEFIVEEKDIHFPKFEDLKIYLKLKKNSNLLAKAVKNKKLISLFASAFNAFIRNDSTSLFRSLRTLVESKFAEYLRYNPEVAASGNFRLHILYFTNDYANGAEYVANLSTLQDAYFKINLSRGISDGK